MNNPYKIRCIEDLVGFSKMLQSTSNNTQRLSGKYVELTRDLDFNSIFSYSNYKAKYKYNSSINAYVPDNTSETTIMELVTDKTKQGFIPIGKVNTAGASFGFQGTFDGNGHEISNIYINSSTYAGLFTGADNATIKNITVSGNIKGANSVGGIMSTCKSTSFYNCTNKATVSGGSNGGILGSCTSGDTLIEGCHNEGSASAGIVGNGKSTVTAKKCYNIGRCWNSGIGSGKIIINCYNTGKTGTQNMAQTGGITCMSGCIIKNCYNSGEITAKPSLKSQYGGAARNECFLEWRGSI